MIIILQIDNHISPISYNSSFQMFKEKFREKINSMVHKFIEKRKNGLSESISAVLNCLERLINQVLIQSS